MSKIKQIRLGLEIIEKYSPNEHVEFGHDIIYAGVDIEVSDEDAAALRELNWFTSTEYDCWAHF